MHPDSMRQSTIPISLSAQTKVGNTYRVLGSFSRSHLRSGRRLLCQLRVSATRKAGYSQQASISRDICSGDDATLYSHISSYINASLLSCSISPMVCIEVRHLPSNHKVVRVACNYRLRSCVYRNARNGAVVSAEKLWCTML